MINIEPHAASDARQALPLIVLLTDFGSDDWYVGVMKGVIKSICPDAELIDLCHSVPPHSIAHGSLMLSAAHRYFPPGSIFVAVVDPGVGTSREPIIVHANERWFLAPNNGLLSFLLLSGAPTDSQLSVPACRILSSAEYQLPNPSDTFHGRDIFAPCAAHLAAGVPWTTLAPKASSLYGLPTTTASVDRGLIEGNIIHFDHFGNAVTNIPYDLLNEFLHSEMETAGVSSISRDQFRVEVGKQIIGKISRTYAEVDPGEALAYWGSAGYLELAVNRGSAREILGLQLLDKVIVHRPAEGDDL